MDDANNEVKPPEGGTPPASDNVTLSKKEYADMVQTMGEMKSIIESLAEKEEQKIALEERRAAAKETPSTSIDLDSLSRRQLADMIYQRTIAEVAQPLSEMIATLYARMEVKDAKEEFADFDEFKDDILKEAQKNTSLSVRDAYLQVKAKKVGFKPPPPAKPDEKEFGGEKPGPSTRKVENLTPLEINEAAGKALADLKAAGKI